MIIKRNELLINAKTWMNLKIILSERSQIHRKQYILNASIHVKL